MSNIELDITIAELYIKNGDYNTALKRYEKILDKLNDIQIKLYLIRVLEYGNLLVKNKEYLQALEQYRKVLEYPTQINVCKNIGICLDKLNEIDGALHYYRRFEEESNDVEDVHILLGDLYFQKIKDNLKAIEYYEKATKKFNNFAIYNTLGHLYSTVYRDEHEKEQVDYLLKAYELAPEERIIVKNLAYVLGKFGYQEADEMYKKLLYLNPTHGDLHSYGAYLVKTGRFYEGFRYLQHRFDKEDLPDNAFPEIFKDIERQWHDGIDISGKTVVIHYEQGFGDTIMFSRFIPQVQKMCNKVIIVVQNTLKDLMVCNFENVMSIDNFLDYPPQYDYWIPMMDLPIICNTTVDTIPLTEGYLDVISEEAKSYGDKYINTNKLKIGFAFEGTESSKETARDIPAKELQPIIDLPNVQCYSFQYDDVYNQKKDIHGYIELKDTFNTWYDTACAMKNMDLMVTTDNGVMNLAGALGVKTFAIFNTISEWRWFDTTGKDLKWYKSIRPFTCPHNEQWNICVQKIIKEIKKIQKGK